MAEEQVTAPDQQKPNNLKWWRIGGIGSIIALLAMLIGNHDGLFNTLVGDGDGSAWVEDTYLILTAGLIAAFLIGDVVMRRRGLRD